MDEEPGKSLDTEIIILMDASGSMTNENIRTICAAYGIALAFHERVFGQSLCSFC